LPQHDVRFANVKAFLFKIFDLRIYNPGRPGRLSHHPLLAVLAESHFVMHGWLRSGNTGTGRGVTEFLKETLALWGDRGLLRVVRADAGFFDKELFTFLEERRIAYIVVARLTKWVKREVTRIVDWRDLDEDYAVGECAIQLMGWDKPRRFVVVRERFQSGGGKETDRSTGVHISGAGDQFAGATGRDLAGLQSPR
jgi:hypothetical protein